MIFDGTEKTIGIGAQAEVVLYNGYAYKIYRNSYPAEWIEFEKKQQRAVNDAGLCSVKYYDTDDKHIVKMDYIDGEMLEVRASAGDVNAFYILSEAFKRVHKVDAEGVDMPRLIDTAGMGLGDEEREEVLSIISRISGKIKSCICHLDMHFLNIMLPKDGGDFIIIDWMNARIAPLIFDYARTYVILDEFSQEGLEAYKQIVLPDLLELGVEEKDFYDAVRVCSILRRQEKEI